MIFFLVMPGLFGGFGNYFVPIFQGSPEVVYPRVNNFSILILLLSYLFLILSLISEFGGGTGWTLYPPLSTSFMTLSPSSTGNLIFGLIISGISSCLTSLNFWTTIHFLRSYYLILSSIPLFPWAFLITAFMLLLTLPILSGTLLLILGDLHSNTLFFDPIFGGDPIFYQHLFWFFGHPEVYILIIPAFGIISIIISGILQLIIFANQSMIFAMSSISLLGGLVWGHHMYTVGLESDTRAYFTGVTILISLPTGTKIFNWLFTYLSNPPLLHLRITSVFLSHLFLLMFTIGGSTGIILGNGAVDLGLHDTYYVVAHFHFVLSLGAIIAIFSGIILNGEKIVATKNLLLSSSCTLSLYHLHLIFIGILLTFSPMHFLGFNVMPRRIPSFPDSFHSWNSLSSIGSGITFLSFGPSVGGSVRIPSHMFPVHHHLITSSVSRSGPEASLRDVTRGGGDKVVRWVEHERHEERDTPWARKRRKERMNEWRVSLLARFPARSDEGAEGPVKWATSRLTSLTRLGTGGSLSLTAAPPHIPPLSVGCRPPGRAPPDPTVRRRYERWERDTSVASQGMNEEKERRVKRRLSDNGLVTIK